MSSHIQNGSSDKALSHITHLRTDIILDIAAILILVACELLVREVFLYTADTTIVIDTKHQRTTFRIEEATDILQNLMGLLCKGYTTLASLGRWIDNARLELQVLTLLAYDNSLRNGDLNTKCAVDLLNQSIALTVIQANAFVHVIGNGHLCQLLHLLIDGILIQRPQQRVLCRIANASNNPHLLHQLSGIAVSIDHNINLTELLQGGLDRRALLVRELIEAYEQPATGIEIIEHPALIGEFGHQCGQREIVIGIGEPVLKHGITVNDPCQFQQTATIQQIVLIKYILFLLLTHLALGSSTLEQIDTVVQIVPPGLILDQVFLFG